MVEQQEISIHAPQWGATRRRECSSSIRTISIHAPQWGATSSETGTILATLFQSTHPSGVRLRGRTAGAVGECISIHAPQWGATSPSAPQKWRAAISIHAPQWGATAGHQTHSRRTIISIHAPQWGATPRKPHGRPALRHFNPRTPVGCDSPISYPYGGMRAFQSTHPSGVRLGSALSVWPG